MRRIALVVLTVALPVGAPVRADARKDEARIEGTWVAFSVESAGKKIPDEELKKAPGKLTLKGGKYTLRMAGQTTTGTYTLDPGKNPRRVTVKPAEGPSKGKTIRGIYELKGDTLRACYDLTGESRPTEFATTKDRPGGVLIVYKREKKSR